MLRQGPGCRRLGCSLPEQSALRPAVFLDRDGTIVEEVGYLNHVSRFRMFPFVPAAIHRLNESGLPVIVVTNQSGVGRGYFPESLVHAVNDLMTQQLVKGGARVDAIYYCPHTAADNCECRKPKTGMLERAALTIVDRYGDMELARNARARSILVRSEEHTSELQSQSNLVCRLLLE